MRKILVIILTLLPLLVWAQQGSVYHVIPRKLPQVVENARAWYALPPSKQKPLPVVDSLHVGSLELNIPNGTLCIGEQCLSGWSLAIETQDQQTGARLWEFYYEPDPSMESWSYVVRAVFRNVDSPQYIVEVLHYGKVSSVVSNTDTMLLDLFNKVLFPVRPITAAY